VASLFFFPVRAEAALELKTLNFNASRGLRNLNSF
jgi:hypothetical protein